MKKIFFIPTICILLLTLFSCKSSTQTNLDNTPTHFLNIMDSYIEKVETMINEITNSSTIEQPLGNTSNELNENNIYTKEDLLPIYNNEPQYQPDSKRIGYLLDYKNLLDQVSKELKKKDTLYLNKSLEIQFKNYDNVKILCNISNTNDIIIKLEYIIEGQTIITAFKTGYINDQFYVKQINYYNAGSDINYSYSEYLENGYYFVLRYDNNDNYSIEYDSGIDNAEFVFSKGMLPSETESFLGYYLRWYDAATQRRYSIEFDLQKEIRSEYYELFNDKDIIFTYIDYDTTNPQIRLAWNMLEASGWDYAYISPDSNDPNNGIYKNDKHLFLEAICNTYINSNSVNLRIEEEYNKDDVTNDILNLSAYDLSFSMKDLNLSYIDSLRNDAKTNALNFNYYKGINLYSDHISDEFLSKIDKDLKYDLDYQE